MKLNRVALDHHTHVLRGHLPVSTADALLAEVEESAVWRQEAIRLFGRSIPQPRLTCWYGVGWSAASRYSTPMGAQPWTPHLGGLRQHLVATTGVPYNSALANRYRDGNDSVSWHADDEATLGTDPVIASVSLGASRTFRLRRRSDRTSVGFVLDHGDVLVMAGACQAEWEHSVPKVRRADGVRVNLTFRRYWDI